MKLVKMSLVAAVAVAGLSTASIAGTTISGGLDGRYLMTMSPDTAKNSGVSRDRIDIHIKSKVDGGLVHAKFRSEKGTIVRKALYAKFNVAGLNVAMGPQTGSVGKLSFGTKAGVSLRKKVGAMKVGASIMKGATDTQDQQTFAITGKAGIVGFAADYQMGGDGANKYLAALAHAKVGPAKLGFGYAAGANEDDDRSVLGFTAGMSVAGMNLGAGYTMAGEGGGKVTEYHISNASSVPKELGYYYGAVAADAKAFFVNVSKKVSGVKVGAYFSSESEHSLSAFQVSAVKKLNAQSTFKAFYTSKTADTADAVNTLELRIASKF